MYFMHIELKYARKVTLITINYNVCIISRLIHLLSELGLNHTDCYIIQFIARKKTQYYSENTLEMLFSIKLSSNSILGDDLSLVLNRTTSGPDQSHIRATSEPHQGHIRATVLPCVFSWPVLSLEC